MSLPVALRPSPNFNDRPQPATIDVLVLHYTGMGSAEAAISHLCDPAAKVSSHYVVDEGGHVLRLVDEEKRAWHAGVSSWAGISDLNGRSIGIEIVNCGHDGGCPPYPDIQMQAVELLCQEIMSRHPIAPRSVVAHSDIAPGRKEDPGEWFDWARLARAGVGVWVEPVEIVDGPVLKLGDRGDPVSELQFRLANYGYGVEVLGVYDAKTEAVVKAFQRHFRPAKIDGVADLSTVATLRLLLDAV
ncbi:MAG: N-acetylmuramoyl-L-alanine amidase [Parvibaculum sp.]|nr:N-acetylmuramoyl-L-alanine amidase [Parvibaculum sp.]|tara:strand:- start:1467 stop:2198 length:732 start_codon:yes stop_codon:yes gene_type:complete